MKKAQFIFLIVLFFLSLCALCIELSAQPFAEIRLRKHQFNNEVITTVDSIYRFWNNRKDVQATPGTSYTFGVGSDTVFYWTPIVGKKIKATITFAEEGLPPVDPPPTGDDTTKIDNLKATKSTTWQHNASTGATGWYKGTSAYSNVVGSTLTFSFTGTKIELWAEKLPSHGRGTVKIDNGTEVPVSFIGTKELPSLVYSSGTLQAVPHTITLKVTSGYCLTDFFVVQNYVPSSGSIPPPSGNIINILPGESLKKIESAVKGSNIQIAAGTFSEGTLTWPLGVNINGSGSSTILRCTTPGQAGLINEVGFLNLKSSSRVDGNQTISNLTLEGDNVAFSGLIVDNVNGVKVKGVNVKNFNFNGVWIRNSTGSEVWSCDFYNTGWSSPSYLSGALNIYNVKDLLIHYNKFRSDKNSKGTGIEALWKNSTLTNVQILNNVFDLSHHNPWNNGSSKNFSMELHDTYYRGLNIGYNEFQNEVSLASHKPGDGTKTLIHDNFGNLEMDSYFLESVASDFEVYNNNIKGCSMFSANFQSNSKWSNHIYRNNTFESSGLVSWGGVFLIGVLGCSNYLIENNTFKTAGNQLIKFMGVTSGVTERNNVTQ